MIESEWLSCIEPTAMLAFLRATRTDSERKLRLFAVACFRRLAHVLPDDKQREGIDTLQQMAEGTATSEMQRRASVFTRHGIIGQFGEDKHFAATMLYRALVSRDAAGHAVSAISGVTEGSLGPAECSHLLREIVGNPFRPVVIQPHWLAWEDGIVVSMAREIEEAQRFAELPYLADALMDAGCDAEPLLRHLRQREGHIRGCWALDSLLMR